MDTFSEEDDQSPEESIFPVQHFLVEFVLPGFQQVEVLPGEIDFISVERDDDLGEKIRGKILVHCPGLNMVDFGHAGDQKNIIRRFFGELRTGHCGSQQKGSGQQEGSKFHTIRSFDSYLRKIECDTKKKTVKEKQCSRGPLREVLPTVVTKLT